MAIWPIGSQTIVLQPMALAMALARGGQTMAFWPIGSQSIVLQPMQDIALKIHTSLLKRPKTLAVAESCTGGLLCKLLTDIPGSSKYFTLGVVAYSNKAKERILKVPSSIIAKKGAVSYEVAQRMAEAARKLIKADIGIGITGIAGPGGSSRDKPVGTVFIAIDTKNNKICEKFHFMGNRASIREKTALKALELLKTIC